MKYKYKLTGLDCANCTQKVEDRLNKEEDIKDCVISFAIGIMTFNSDNPEIDTKIKTIINEMEPDVEVENAKNKKHRHHHKHNHEHHHHDHECDCGCEHEHYHEHDENQHIGKYKYKLTGLDCANCTQKVEDRLNKEKDIKDCVISFATGIMTFNSDNPEIDTKIKTIINEMEPDVEVESTKNKKHEHHHKHHHECGCGEDHHHEHHHHDHECDCGCEHEHHHEHDENQHIGKYKYKLTGLDCANCTQKVEDRLNKEEDIKDCVISFATGIMTFNSDNPEIDTKIKTIINEMEPDVEVESIKNKKHEHHHKHNREHDHHHHDHECGCGCNHEHHEHHHHDHECDCGCEHEHHHEELPERDIAGGMKIHIYGLDCANCAMKVENEIKKQNYIDDAVINFSSETLIVKASENSDLIEKLQKVVDSVEDGVTLSLDKKEVRYEKPKLFVFKENVELIEGVIVFIGALITTGWFSTFLYIAAYLLIGYKVILKALKNIGRKDFLDENFLMCIATFGALALQDYSEAIAVMLFYAIGEIFQGYAVNKTRNSISSLMDIKSEYANLIVDGEIEQVDPEEVEIGDTIVVKIGEKVPLDGKVIKGTSMLDTSSLTGESVPRHVEVGEEVLSGVVNLSEILYIEVEKPYEDSTVSRIIDLVENSASKKAKIEKFITRFAKVYTPTVVGLAILLLFVPMLVLPNQSFYTWLYRACTFLVVSCPCALVISIPLGLYAGLGKASAIGVLIKGGNYLELLKDVDTVVFDKTGTLTKGEFEVVEISDKELLEIGAYGEFMSNHPIARSIVKDYNQDIDSKRISHFKEIPGKGIEVCIDGEQYYLGNEKFFNSLNIKVTLPETVGTIVYIARNNSYLGYIVVADVIKETTVPGIKGLKNANVKNTVMLTGDHEVVAHDIAGKIGIDTVYSDLLPQDKVSKLEQLLGVDSVVAFVGDGINDAPVLARADLGIAMGGIGSDVAIEAADMVLMTDDITMIAKAMDVSKFTNVILKENVIFTLVIKIGVLILTLFGLTNMWMGVFADVGVTLIAICNSMRILYKK